MKNNLKERFRFNFLKHNLLAKVICLVLGIIVWLYVMDAENPVVPRSFTDVPVQIIGREQLENQNLILGDVESDSVTVTITGPWKDVMKLSNKDFTLTAKLNGVGQGTVILPIEHNINPTLNPKLSSDTIKVPIDAIVTVQKPLKIRLVGTVPPGVTVGEIEPAAWEVSVKGPSADLNRIAYVEGLVDLASNLTSFTSYMSLTPMDEANKAVQDEMIEVIEQFVEADVPFLSTRTVPIELNYKSNLGDKYKLAQASINVPSVEIRGEKKLIDSIVSIKTKEYFVTAESGTEVQLDLILPVGITANINRVIAAFEVLPFETRTFNFPSSSITMLNTSPDWSYVLDPTISTVQVEIQDTLERLAAISETSLKLSIDVSQMKNGIWSPAILVEGQPSGVKARVIPEKIQVTIAPKVGP